jgi:TatA/E family protein of Tat protein translocase
MIEGILAPWHWIILIVVLMLIFGPSKLPGIASSIGKGISGVRKEIKEIADESSGVIGELKELNPLSGIDLKSEVDPEEQVVEGAEKGAEKATGDAPEKSLISASTLKTLASPGGLKGMAVAATIKKATSPTVVLGKLLLPEDAAPSPAPTPAAEDKGSDTPSD